MKKLAYRLGTLREADPEMAELEASYRRRCRPFAHREWQTVHRTEHGHRRPAWRGHRAVRNPGSLADAHQ